MIKQAVKAGVKIAMGTDAGLFKHGINLEELQLMQRAGMSPEAVLHASTQSAAQLLGFDDRGAIRPGLRADLAVFRGDLTSFEGLSSRVAGVYKSGRKVR